MSTAQTFWLVFGLLLLTACLAISAVSFGRLWFVDRPRLQAKMREALGGEREPGGLFSGLWSGVQAFLIVAFGTLCLIGIGILSLLWVPLVYMWYRLRGKPLPDPNLRFDNED